MSKIVKQKHGGSLKILEKGETANPKGRPKLPDLSALMDIVMGEEKDGITAAEAILKKLRHMASQGNLKAAEILLDRGYGKPKQALDVTTDGDKVNTVIERIITRAPDA